MKRGRKMKRGANARTFKQGRKESSVNRRSVKRGGIRL